MNEMNKINEKSKSERIEKVKAIKNITSNRIYADLPLVGQETKKISGWVINEYGFG